MGSNSFFDLLDRVKNKIPTGRSTSLDSSLKGTVQICNQTDGGGSLSRRLSVQNLRICSYFEDPVGPPPMSRNNIYKKNCYVILKLLFVSSSTICLTSSLRHGIGVKTFLLYTSDAAYDLHGVD